MYSVLPLSCVSVLDCVLKIYFSRVRNICSWRRGRRRMRRVGLTRIRSILLLFLVSVIAYSPVTIYVNAQTTSGLVCVSPGSDSCPILQPIFTGKPGTQLRVNVVVQNDEAFDSCSLVIGVNSSILQPVSVNAKGGVLPKINIIICYVGQGNPCAYWLGLGPGDVRVAGWGSVTNTTGVD